MTGGPHRAIRKDDSIGRNSGQNELSVLQAGALGVENEQRRNDLGLRLSDGFLQRHVRLRLGCRLSGKNRRHTRHAGNGEKSGTHYCHWFTFLYLVRTVASRCRALERGTSAARSPYP